MQNYGTGNVTGNLPHTVTAINRVVFTMSTMLKYVFTS